MEPYDCHLGIRSFQNSLLDAEAKEAQKQVNAIKCESREYPGHSVGSVVIDEGEKSDE